MQFCGSTPNKELWDVCLYMVFRIMLSIMHSNTILVHVTLQHRCVNVIDEKPAAGIKYFIQNVTLTYTEGKYLIRSITESSSDTSVPLALDDIKGWLEGIKKTTKNNYAGDLDGANLPIKLPFFHGFPLPRSHPLENRVAAGELQRKARFGHASRVV